MCALSVLQGPRCAGESESYTLHKDLRRWAFSRIRKTSIGPSHTHRSSIRNPCSLTLKLLSLQTQWTRQTPAKA